MKKIVIILGLVCMYIPIFSVVWENDPNITPEQRDQRRELNERMRERNEEREVVKQQKIAEAAERYIQKINEIKGLYPALTGYAWQDDPNYARPSDIADEAVLNERWRTRKLEREAAKNRDIYYATQAYLEELKTIEAAYAPLIG